MAIATLKNLYFVINRLKYTLFSTDEIFNDIRSLTQTKVTYILILVNAMKHLKFIKIQNLNLRVLGQARTLCKTRQNNKNIIHHLNYYAIFLTNHCQDLSILAKVDAKILIEEFLWFIKSIINLLGRKNFLFLERSLILV